MIEQLQNLENTKASSQVFLSNVPQQLCNRKSTIKLTFTNSC